MALDVKIRQVRLAATGKLPPKILENQLGLVSPIYGKATNDPKYVGLVPPISGKKYE